MVRRRNLAVLMSLHELDLAQKVSDRVACVHNHAIERCGAPEEIFTAEYILELYEAARGSYNPDFGCLELEPPAGAPQVFVIGGGLSHAGSILLDRIQAEYRKFAFHAFRDTEFVLAELGNDAGIYGCVRMLLQEE